MEKNTKDIYIYIYTIHTQYMDIDATYKHILHKYILASQLVQWQRIRLPVQEMQETIPGSEGSPGVGNGDSLQYPCLEKSMDKGARWV